MGESKLPGGILRLLSIVWSWRPWPLGPGYQLQTFFSQKWMLTVTTKSVLPSLPLAYQIQIFNLDNPNNKNGLFQNSKL
jgi:hypothetical protein